MKLNEEQMEIMRRVRSEFEQPYSRFICITVNDIGHYMAYESTMNSGPNARGKEIHRMRGVTSELESQIQSAIDDLYTMEAWLYVETGFRRDCAFQDLTPKREAKVLPNILYKQYLSMARMAWLDKIIETGEIV